MQHKHKERIKVSFSQGMNLLLPYIRKKVMEQTRSMAVIAIYLLLFQILILRVAIANASVITLGLLLVIMGLSFFMEGLFIGIMPLGEVIGIKLPQKSNLLVIMIFSFILGFGATLAEPAIGVLRAAGTSVKAWDAPLLYLLLNRYPGYLVGAVGIGVGLAVMAGMLRFLYSWSLKPFAIVLVLLLLSVSVWAVFEPNMRSLTGVAWDCGGITTGPVTVPLVLALGIGICRVVGSAGSGTAGFGVVTLASLFPILTVMMLGIPFLHSVPKPMAEAEFMAARERAEIVRMFETPEQMTGYVLQNASPSSQLIYFGGDTAKMISCLQSLVCDDIKCARVMGADPGMLRKWALEKGTSIQQAAVFGSVSLVPDTDIKKAELDPRTFGKTVISNTKAACQAIIPLCLFLIFMLIFVITTVLANRFGMAGRRFRH